MKIWKNTRWKHFCDFAVYGFGYNVKKYNICIYIYVYTHSTCICPNWWWDPTTYLKLVCILQTEKPFVWDVPHHKKGTLQSFRMANCKRTFKSPQTLPVLVEVPSFYQSVNWLKLLEYRTSFGFLSLEIPWKHNNATLTAIHLPPKDVFPNTPTKTFH